MNLLCEGSGDVFKIFWKQGGGIRRCPRRWGRSWCRDDEGKTHVLPLWTCTRFVSFQRIRVCLLTFSDFRFI